MHEGHTIICLCEPIPIVIVVFILPPSQDLACIIYWFWKWIFSVVRRFPFVQAAYHFLSVYFVQEHDCLVIFFYLCYWFLSCVSVRFVMQFSFRTAPNCRALLNFFIATYWSLNSCMLWNIFWFWFIRFICTIALFCLVFRMLVPPVYTSFLFWFNSPI